jgi:flagellar biosynthetic protein FliQ
MEPDMALDLGRHALMTALLIALPLLCVGLVVGVLISILQAVTQVQEMTLTFVPKIIAVALAAIFLLPWFMARLTEFASEMFSPMTIP